MKKLIAVILAVMSFTVIQTSAAVGRMYYDFTFADGYYYDLKTGVGKSDARFAVSSRKPVKSDSITIVGSNWHHILWWGENNQYIGYHNSTKSSYKTNLFNAHETSYDHIDVIDYDSFVTTSQYNHYIFNNAWVLDNIIPGATYTLSYNVTLLYKPDSSLGGNVIARFRLYNNEKQTSIDLAYGLSPSQYSDLEVGETIHVENTLKIPTPSIDLDHDLSGYTLVFTSGVHRPGEHPLMRVDNVRLTVGDTIPTGRYFGTAGPVVTPPEGAKYFHLQVCKERDNLIDFIEYPPQGALEVIDKNSFSFTDYAGSVNHEVIYEDLDDGYAPRMVLEYGHTYYIRYSLVKLAELLYEKVLPPSTALFYGGWGGDSPSSIVIKADLDDLSTLNTSVSYGGLIQSIAVDDTHIYVGGYTRTVRKYLKSDLSYVGESANYGADIFSIAVDDTHIYVGGSHPTCTVRKYLKSDLSYIGETASYGAYAQINSIAVDDTHIYVGGLMTDKVRKYLKSDLSYVGETESYGYSIYSIAVDDTHVYVGGGTGTSTNKKVRKYLKSDLSYVGETPSYGSTIRSIAIDDTHIYVGGWTTNKVRKYLKSDLSYVGETPSYGNYIEAVAIDDTHIYVGGQTTQTVRKYLKSDLSYVGESPNYGGTIYSIAIDGGNDKEVGILFWFPYGVSWGSIALDGIGPPKSSFRLSPGISDDWFQELPVGENAFVEGTFIAGDYSWPGSPYHGHEPYPQLWVYTSHYGANMIFDNIYILPAESYDAQIESISEDPVEVFERFRSTQVYYEREAITPPDYTNLVDRVNAWLDNNNLNNNLFKTLVAIVVIVAVVIGLALLKAPGVAIIFSVVLVFALGVMFGWIPMWLVIPIALLCLGLILIKLKAGGGGIDESD